MQPKSRYKVETDAVEDAVGDNEEGIVTISQDVHVTYYYNIY